MQKNDEYLDLKIYDCIKDFRREKSVVYELIYELIEILRGCEEDIQSQGPNKKNVCLLAMMMQLNKFYQSAVLMFEHGLKDVGDSLIRTCIELSIKIVELIKNDNFISDYELESFFEMRTTTKIMIDHRIDDLVNEETLNKCLELCNSKTDGKKRPKIKIKDLIEKDEMYREYVLYRLHCNYTHQSIDQMKSLIVCDDISVTVDGNFQLDKFNDSIAMLISVLMIALPVLLDEYIHDEKIKECYRVFEKKFEGLFAKE